LNSSVLVTGGAGFIGSHLVTMLLKRGYSVTVLDNLSTGSLQNLQAFMDHSNFKFIKGDIQNSSDLKKALKNAMLVVHLAALIDVAASVTNPLKTHNINTTATLKLLNQAIQSKVERLIFASSTAVYGDTDQLPITEDTPIKPLSPYAASKAAAEAYCNAYANLHNINIVTLRFFNVYGAGNEKNPYSGVITKFIQNAKANKPLIIEGDGEQTRDFIHVSDVANAIIMTLQSKQVKTGVFNVCTGKSTSINMLAQTVKGVSQENLQINHAAKRLGDIKDSLGNPNKTAQNIRFKATTTLKEGIKQQYTMTNI
jgi:UDP-glucose 4-epimerase